MQDIEVAAAAYAHTFVKYQVDRRPAADPAVFVFRWHKYKRRVWWEFAAVADVALAEHPQTPRVRGVVLALPSLRDCAARGILDGTRPCECDVPNVKAHVAPHTTSNMPSRIGLPSTGDIVWLVADDVRARGQSPEEPEGISAWMGVRCCKSLTDRWHKLERIPQEPAGYVAPIAMYHGTHVRAVRGIIAEGLFETMGMVGKGVYVGTFWKATRYAMYDAQYNPRPPGTGMVLRVLVFPSSAGTAPLTADGADAVALFKSTPWRAAGWGVRVVPRLEGASTAGPGCVRNEEWCVDKSTVEVVGVGRVNMGTVKVAPWDPWWRCQMLLPHTVCQLRS